MNTEINYYNRSFLYAASISIFFSILIGVICLDEKIQIILLNKFGRINIIILIIIFLTFLILFIAVYRINLKLFKKNYIKESNKRTTILVMIIVILITNIMLMVSFKNEDKIYASQSNIFFWHQIPLPLLILILLLVNCAFVIIIYNYKIFLINNNTKTDNLSYWLVSLSIASLVGYALYVPNFFASDVLHIHAYYNSIYNVFNGIPFSEQVTTIYGHYGLLIAPILKIARLIGINNIYKVFCLVMSFIGFLSIALNAYTIQVFIKNKIVRIICIIAIGLPILAMHMTAYLQVNPHRIFVISLIMALIALAVKKNIFSKKICIFGYIICIISVIWNTEMGIFALVTWSIFYCCIELQEKKANVVTKIVFHIVLIIICFFIAISVVNIYNLINGGSINSIKTFMFPLFTNSYMNFLEVPLTRILTPWMFMISTLLLFFAKGISSTIICRKGNAENPRAAAYLAISVLGLSSITYAFNRPAYFNFDIIYYLIILLIGIEIQHSMRAVKVIFCEKKFATINAITAGLGIIALCIVFTLSLGCISNLGSATEKREISKSKSSLNDLSSFAGSINSTISSDTVGIGIGVVELYSMLGKDTKIYTMDYSDIVINQDLYNYADDILGRLQNKSVLTSSYSLKIHEELQLQGYSKFLKTHRLEKNWTLEGFTIEYYVPIK